MRRQWVGILVVLAATSGLALAGARAATASAQVRRQSFAGTRATSLQGGRQLLTLADSRFSFISPSFPGLPAFGEVSVSGDTITFYSSNRCNGTGTYQWSVSDGTLTFVEVSGSSDPCNRRAALTSGGWTRP